MRPFNLNEIKKTNKQVIITEEQFSKLMSSLISESLSISDEVCNATNRVFSILRIEIDQAQKDNGEFPTTIFGQRYTVKWSTVNYEQGTKLQVGANINFKDKTLTIVAVKNNGKLDIANLGDSLQHEIEHLYQKISNPEDRIFNEKSSKLYDKVLEIMNTATSQEQLDTARAVYLCFNAEQDAYVNGLYAFLQSANVTVQNLGELIRQNQVYKHLQFLRKFNRKLHDDNNFINSKGFQEACLILKRNLKWFKLHINKAIIRFARKINHISDKITMELY